MDHFKEKCSIELVIIFKNWPSLNWQNVGFYNRIEINKIVFFSNEFGLYFTLMFLFDIEF